MTIARASLLHRPSRGAALLTALVIVTLVTTVATAMIWQQWRAIQIEAAERSQAQAQMILNGALDWARLLLREDWRADLRKNDFIDPLNEPWATPLREARLTTFLAADKDHNSEDAPDAFLSGSIQDAQARFNLRNLIRNGRESDPDAKALRRLCEFVNVPMTTCDALIRSTQQAILVGIQQITPPAGAAASAAPKSARPLPQVTSDLAWLGIEPGHARRLMPHVVMLPGNTAINLNTASKEVIAALIPGLDLASAQRLIQVRQERPLRSSGDLRVVIGGLAPAEDTDRLDYKTAYFEVTGTLRLDEMIVSQRSMLRRNQSNLIILTSDRIGPGAATAADATAWPE
jgi:general secretion pathway protein K